MSLREATQLNGLMATKEEFDVLQKRLADLKNQLANLRRSKQSTAESGGDYWHDNPEFASLESRERALMTRIGEFELTIGQIRIVEPTTSSDVVGIGSIVSVEFENGSCTTFTIAGHMCGDPENGRIAYDSPLGNALMGSGTGATCSYIVEQRSITVIVKEIGP